MSETSERPRPPEKVTTTIIPKKLARSTGIALLEAINDPIERMVGAMGAAKKESGPDFQQKLDMFEERLRGIMAISRGLAEAQETKVVESSNLMEFQFSNTKSTPSLRAILYSLPPFEGRAKKILYEALAHKANNYLVPIVGYSEILQQNTGLTEETRVLMGNINHAAQEIGERLNLIMGIAPNTDKLKSL